MLENSGYEVFAASMPDDAMRISGKQDAEIDLLMADVVLTEMNGCDLAIKLRRARPNMKTLFMTGNTTECIASFGELEAGVYFIQKPFTLKALHATLRRIFDDEDN